MELENLLPNGKKPRIQKIVKAIKSKDFKDLVAKELIERQIDDNENKDFELYADNYTLYFNGDIDFDLTVDYGGYNDEPEYDEHIKSGFARDFVVIFEGMEEEIIIDLELCLI